MNLIRKPIAAGTFYPDDFSALGKQLKKCFDILPSKTRNNQILTGAIIPHAGYTYSGKTASYAYKEIAESKLPNTFIILGPNHTGAYNSNFSLSLDNFETPLGIVETDQELASKLQDEFPKLREDKAAHFQEHSIEVQLPFLQFATMPNKIKILPIIITNPTLEDMKQFAFILSKQTRLTVIASSDFTHYGANFNYTPFKYNLKQEIEKLDKKAIDLILKLETEKFYKYCQNKTICGYLPITILIEYAKLKASKPKLLNYSMSGDLIKDYENSVSYVSIIFK